MNIYLDTNILMDVFVGPERENYDDSVRILDAINKHPDLVGVVSVQSLTDIAYTFTKYGAANRRQFYSQVRFLLQFLKLVTLSPANATDALRLEPQDFEDQEQLLCAEDNLCAWFITGDHKLIDSQESAGGVPVVSPGRFLELVSQ